MTIATAVPDTLCLILPDEGATDRLGRVLARHLLAGDTVLLAGQIGAGKTHLARAMIRARMGAATDVPSPSFTLVQTYGEGAEAIWHADLYRLSHPDEVRELGLEDAFGRALCLIEWPDRMAGTLPQDALNIALRQAGDGRHAHLSGGRGDIAQVIGAAWTAGEDAS
jgi:tRNA threonylcarbamoyladenosine biosynthesis protein TsaE